MRNIMMALIVLAAVSISQGCAVLGPRMGKIVHAYCDNSTDTDQVAIRERMDKATDPHTVRVNCIRE